MKQLMRFAFAAWLFASCTCGKKYTDLQLALQKSETLRKEQETDYKSEVKKRDEAIADLVEHIKRLNQQLKELELKP